jgi:hypothetical protein
MREAIHILLLRKEDRMELTFAIYVATTLESRGKEKTLAAGMKIVSVACAVRPLFSVR